MIRNTPLLGNCLLGAYYLRWRYGGCLRGIRTREGGPKHWICKLDNGETWHFKRIRYVLPWPVCYLCFLGRFEQLSDRRANTDACTDTTEEERSREGVGCNA